MKPTILESPYVGEVERNVKYAQLCMSDMLKKGEAPYASHLLYTQNNVLDDTVKEERDLGINAGFTFRDLCSKTVFYVDFGFSKGMVLGLKDCLESNKHYSIRELPEHVMIDHFKPSLFKVSVDGKFIGIASAFCEEKALDIAISNDDEYEHIEWACLHIYERFFEESISDKADEDIIYIETLLSYQRAINAGYVEVKEVRKGSHVVAVNLLYVENKRR